MPRSARIDIPNLLQHVIVRGIEKRDIFADHDDQRHFVKRFSDLLVATGTDCLAWALLDNHFHLLLRPRQTTLANFMRRLLTGYAVSFNLRHRRCGHLFQNRYKSIVCDEEAYLLELVRYIHLNPLRAGLVQTIDELDRYAWCGHAVLMGGADLPGQMTGEVLSRFGKSLKASRRRYHSFIEDGLAMGHRGDLVGSGSRQQPETADSEESAVRDSRILGRGDFVEQILRQTEPESGSAKLPLEEIIERVRLKFDLSLPELTSRTRTKRVADARAIICHVAFVCGHRGVDIARRLGITGSGVSMASQRGKKAIFEHRDLLAMIDAQATD
jgi:REP element-mobilizing transposase RayT